MPSFPPRDRPIKKMEQLAKRQMELQHAIRNNFPVIKLKKVVERYRQAELSLLKARIHECKEREYKKIPQLNNIENLEEDVKIWTNKTFEQILSEITAARERTS